MKCLEKFKLEWDLFFVGAKKVGKKSVGIKPTKLNNSQAAMEFLMTYGWALLVVLMAIAALAFFGLLNPDNFLPDKVDISNRAIAIYPTETNKIIVKNNGPEILYNVSFNFTSANCVQTQGKDIPTGENEKFMIWCNDVPPKNKKFKSDFNIYYYTKTKGHNIDHVANGRYVVTGNYVSSDGLVGYWSFDGDYDDFSGQDNDGTPHDASIIDNALQLDGDGDYVDLPNNMIADPLNSFSISVWANTNDLSTGSNGIIDNIGAGYFTMRGDHYDEVWFNWINSSDDWAGAITAGDLIENKWYNIVAMYDGYEGRVYVNGVLEGSRTYGGGIRNSDSPLIGKDYGFNGSIDQLMIFNRALTEDEVESLYKAGR